SSMASDCSYVELAGCRGCRRTERSWLAALSPKSAYFQRVNVGEVLVKRSSVMRFLSPPGAKVGQTPVRRAGPTRAVALGDECAVRPCLGACGPAGSSLCVQRRSPVRPTERLPGRL